MPGRLVLGRSAGGRGGPAIVASSCNDCMTVASVSGEPLSRPGGASVAASSAWPIMVTSATAGPANVASTSGGAAGGGRVTNVASRSGDAVPGETTVASSVRGWAVEANVASRSAGAGGATNVPSCLRDSGDVGGSIAGLNPVRTSSAKVIPVSSPGSPAGAVTTPAGADACETGLALSAVPHAGQKAQSGSARVPQFAHR